MPYRIPDIPGTRPYPFSGDLMEVGNLATTPKSAKMDPNLFVQNTFSVTGPTGGGTNLDNVPTVNRKLPSSLLILSDTLGMTGVWQLLTSAQATGAGCVQPLDNAALRWIKYL